MSHLRIKKCYLSPLGVALFQQMYFSSNSLMVWLNTETAGQRSSQAVVAIQISAFPQVPYLMTSNSRHMCLSFAFLCHLIKILLRFFIACPSSENNVCWHILIPKESVCSNLKDLVFLWWVYKVLLLLEISKLYKIVKMNSTLNNNSKIQHTH